MIGFVTWPSNYTCENMYVTKTFLIGDFAIGRAASHWPHTFLHPECFYLATEL